MTISLVPRGSIYQRPCADYGTRPTVATEPMVRFEDGERVVTVPASKLDEARKLIGGKR